MQLIVESCYCILFVCCWQLPEVWVTHCSRVNAVFRVACQGMRFFQTMCWYVQKWMEIYVKACQSFWHWSGNFRRNYFPPLSLIELKLVAGSDKTDLKKKLKVAEINAALLYINLVAMGYKQIWRWDLAGMYHAGFMSDFYMSEGSATDIYCYWVDVDFFSIKLKVFFSRFWTSGSKNLQ